jgi:hypothetical protein
MTKSRPQSRLVDGSRTATGFELNDLGAAWEARQRLIGPNADETLIGYSLALEHVFGNMRALLGQIAGLLILVQSRLQRDAPDLPDLAIARERCAETTQYLRTLKIPEARAANGPKLKEAFGLIQSSLSIISEMRKPRIDEGVTEASRRLREAYALMQSICDHRIGLTMVDTTDACCSCGKAIAGTTTK